MVDEVEMTDEADMVDDELCKDCGEAVPDTDVIYHGEIGPLCESCADEYHPCESWGCTVYSNDTRIIDDTVMCEDCASRYTTCDGCETSILCEDTYSCDTCDRSELCEYCSDEYHNHGSENIHDYSYKPIPIFHGNGTKRYFGVELEIDGAGESGENADELLRYSDEESLFYIKSDSSLNDGLEIVTHPATLDFHLKRMPWKDIVTKAAELGYKSHQTDTCGLHIHVSTAALAVGGRETATSKLVVLFWRLWPQLVKFSRRNSEQIRSWCQLNYDGQSLNSNDLYYSKQKGHYASLNFEPDDTLEIRLFRGSLRWETIAASIELVDVLIDLALTRGFGWINRATWDAVIDHAQGRKHLMTYLETRNLGRNYNVHNRD